MLLCQVPIRRKVLNKSRLDRIVDNTLGVRHRYAHGRRINFNGELLDDLVSSGAVTRIPSSNLTDFGDELYTTPITLGNGQSFTVDLDTGSSDVWLRGCVAAFVSIDYPLYPLYPSLYPSHFIIPSTSSSIMSTPASSSSCSSTSEHHQHHKITFPSDPTKFDEYKYKIESACSAANVLQVLLNPCIKEEIITIRICEMDERD